MSKGILYSSLCIHSSFSQILILCNSSVLKFNTFVRPHGSDGVVLASYGVGGKRLVGAVRGIGDSLESGGMWRGGDTYVLCWELESREISTSVLCTVRML